MANITNNEPVKFDFESTREGCFTAFIFIGFIIMFCGLGGKHGHPPPNIAIIFAGLVTGIISAMARFSTDDYMIFDPDTGYILLSNQFLFVKTTTFLCPIKDLLEVKLETSRRSNKSGSYTDFFVQVRIPGYGIRKDKQIVSMGETLGYQFNSSVETLRSKALKIADMAGCKITYSDKIAPEKRKQPGALKKEEKKKEFQPYSPQYSINPVRKGTRRIEFNNFLKKPEKKPLPLSEIKSDFIESDFTADSDSKTCKECGEKSPSNCQFCNNCGAVI
ncbi:MAG: zinc ribbon domain-containing protein [Candidatus Eremiobacterota bacterium]